MESYAFFLFPCSVAGVGEEEDLEIFLNKD